MARFTSKTRSLVTFVVAGQTYVCEHMGNTDDEYGETIVELRNLEGEVLERHTESAFMETIAGWIQADLESGVLTKAPTHKCLECGREYAYTDEADRCPCDGELSDCEVCGNNGCDGTMCYQMQDNFCSEEVMNPEECLNCGLKKGEKMYPCYLDGLGHGNICDSCLESLS